jgi:hypothetical protein
VSEQTFKLIVGIESFDPEDMGFILGEQIAVASTATFPEIVNTTIPTGGTPSISLPDLVTDQVISVTTLDSLLTTRTLTQIPNAGTLAAGQFKVGSGTVNFYTTDGNKAINIWYDKAFTNFRSLGVVANPGAWGDCSFSGIICGDRFTQPMRVYIPSMYPTPKFDLTIGDKSTAEIEFTMKLTGNYRIPLLIGDL